MVQAGVPNAMIAKFILSARTGTCHSQAGISEAVICEDLFDTGHEFWVKDCRFKSWHCLFGCEQAK
jgi:hypothetical protein